MLIRRYEGGRTESDEQQHRQLQQRGRPFEQPRRPRMQPLQHAKRAAAAGGQRDLIDHIASQRAQVKEELIRGRQRAHAPRLQAREVRPVQFVQVDRRTVGLPLQRDSRRLVQPVTLGRPITAEQMVGQLQAKVVTERRSSGLRDNPALRDKEVAGPTGCGDGSAFFFRRRCGAGRTLANRRFGRLGLRRQPADRNDDLVQFTFDVARQAVAAVAQQARQFAHRLPGKLVGDPMHGDHGDTLRRHAHDLLSPRRSPAH